MNNDRPRDSRGRSAVEVLDEKVAGTLTKSYQYSPWGERLSQVKHNSDGTTEDGYYGYNSHSDVETLTNKDGDTKSTYGYTAYGDDDSSEFTGIDKPDAADPTKEAYSPYRFNAKRWDAQSGTYDMGFRDYNPGLNRFTIRDMYNGALADMSLGVDPFTGNRYAFGGGNPTSFVEIDGHTSCDITGMCGGTYRETPMIKAEESAIPDACDSACQKVFQYSLDNVPLSETEFGNPYGLKPVPHAGAAGGGMKAPPRVGGGSVTGGAVQLLLKVLLGAAEDYAEENAVKTPQRQYIDNAQQNGRDCLNSSDVPSQVWKFFTGLSGACNRRFRLPESGGSRHTG